MKNKNYTWTFNQVIEKFEEIEIELALDKSLIKNVPWWDLVRQPLFLKLLNELNLREQKKPSRYSFFKDTFFNISRFVKNILLIFSSKSSLWIKRRDYLVWGHPRRKLENGIYIDPYVDPFIKLFPSPDDFTIIERDINGQHLSPVKTKNLHYADQLLSLAYLFSKFRILKMSKEQSLIISKLEKTIFKSFSCKIDINKLVKNKIRRWLGIYPVMRLFFKIKKPKLFFVVVNEDHESIIAAAKSIGIVTLELQHGSPSRGKMNYDYSSGIKNSTFVDRFLSFGEHWTQNFSLPIDDSKIIPFGFPYLHEKISLYPHITKENRLVVISQIDNLKNLVNFTKKISKKFSRKIIVEYKPHPSEFYAPKPDYFKDLENSGVIISEKDKDLYEIFARSRWQDGVYSTALYEGLYFDVACFILKVPGFQHMQKLIDFKLASVVETADDIDLNWIVDKKKISKIFSKPEKKNVEKIINLGHQS